MSFFFFSRQRSCQLPFITEVPKLVVYDEQLCNRKYTSVNQVSSTSESELFLFFTMDMLHEIGIREEVL